MISEFNKHFQDFESISIVAQFVKLLFIEIDAEEFFTCVVEHFDFQEDNAAVELNLLHFQNDVPVKSLSSGSENICFLVSEEKYPVLVLVYLKVKAMFSSAYLCKLVLKVTSFRISNANAQIDATSGKEGNTKFHLVVGYQNMSCKLTQEVVRMSSYVSVQLFLIIYFSTCSQ